MNAKSQNKKNKSSNLADYERGGREWWEYIIAGSREQGAGSREQKAAGGIGWGRGVKKGRREPCYNHTTTINSL